MAGRTKLRDSLSGRLRLSWVEDATQGGPRAVFASRCLWFGLSGYLGVVSRPLDQISDFEPPALLSLVSDHADSAAR